MPPAVFEPTFPTSEPTQTHTLDRAAAGIDSDFYLLLDILLTLQQTLNDFRPSVVYLFIAVSP